MFRVTIFPFVPFREKLFHNNCFETYELEKYYSSVKIARLKTDSLRGHVLICTSLKQITQRKRYKTLSFRVGMFNTRSFNKGIIILLLLIKLSPCLTIFSPRKQTATDEKKILKNSCLESGSSFNLNQSWKALVRCSITSFFFSITFQQLFGNSRFLLSRCHRDNSIFFSSGILSFRLRNYYFSTIPSRYAFLSHVIATNLALDYYIANFIVATKMHNRTPATIDTHTL